MPDPVAVNFSVHITDDDVPEPHSSRKGRYRNIVAATVIDHQRRWIPCEDRRTANAVYAGLKRARDRYWPELARIHMRSTGNGTYRVYIEPSNTFGYNQGEGQ